MRFYFKVFFTTMLLTVTCTAAAGYLLIRDNVSTLLEAETTAAVESGTLAAYALSAADPSDQLRLAETAEAMDITYGGETLRFLLLDEDGAVLYNALPPSFTAPLTALLDPENRVWTVADVDGGRSVLALRPVRLSGVLCYVGTVRDVGPVYDAQVRQYRFLVQILLCTLVLGGAVTLLVTRLLTRQLRAVSVASRRIAAGNLDCRAPVQTDDEFGRLAAQFNRMADALQEKIDALQEENERRVLFTGAFAHELKTPLTSIIGYADLLRSRAADERTALCAEYIFSEGQRLERLSMRLLELIVLRETHLQTEEVEAAPFFQKIALEAVGAAQVSVEPARFRGEPALLHTVFLNLLDNGRKAAGEGGTVSLTGRVNGGDYVVTVRDNGCGMTPEELAQILRPFYRADPSRSRAQGGCGLGLAICDAILQLHGFTLHYESAPGRGTAATVTMKGAVVP